MSEQSSAFANNWNLPEPSVVNLEELNIKYSEISGSIHIRGTNYIMRCPENWNGILLSDLDYCRKCNSTLSIKLLSMGYGMCGTERRPERPTNYDPSHEIHDMISVFDLYEASFGKPHMTIEYGSSGGGTIAIAMTEDTPDRIDGAISAGGSTSQWMANQQLDGYFVLQTLLAPALPIVKLPIDSDAVRTAFKVGMTNVGEALEETDAVKDANAELTVEEIGAHWRAALEAAQQTPEGRARIALAMAIGQWPAWGGFGPEAAPRPDPSNLQAVQEAMYACMHTLLPSNEVFGTTMLECSCDGQLKFNDNSDYAQYFENANAEFKEIVKQLYALAGISLEDDLKTINAGTRVTADDNGIAYWCKPGRTHLGTPKVPLLRIHTTGDGLVYPALVQGYEELVNSKGHGDFFRSAFSNRWGHCTFSDAEWIAAIEVLVERIESSEWPDTSKEAMNQRSKNIDPLTEATYCDYEGVGKYNRTWIPSIDDYKRVAKHN